MTKSSNACQRLRPTAKALKLLGIILRFMQFFRKVIYIWVGGTGGKFRLKKEKYLIFLGLLKVIRPNSH